MNLATSNPEKAEEAFLVALNILKSITNGSNNYKSKNVKLLSKQKSNNKTIKESQSSNKLNSPNKSRSSSS